MTSEAQRELRAWWEAVKDNSIVSINEFAQMAELVAKVDMKIEERVKQLEQSRDMWKQKWSELKQELKNK